MAQMLKEAAYKMKLKESGRKVSFEDFKANPTRFGVIPFNVFKKNRQLKNKLPAKRPPRGHISHAQAYENLLKEEYQKFINQI